MNARPTNPYLTLKRAVIRLYNSARFPRKTALLQFPNVIGNRTTTFHADRLAESVRVANALGFNVVATLEGNNDLVFSAQPKPDFNELEHII